MINEWNIYAEESKWLQAIGFKIAHQMKTENKKLLFLIIYTPKLNSNGVHQTMKEKSNLNLQF